MTGDSVFSAQARRRPQTAAELVADTLRRSILNGELRAGTRLGLAEVAAGMEVSTTPVREALRELSFEGLVHFDSYRGGTVNAVSEADVREIVRIRQVLEPVAIRDSVEHMTPEILAKAEQVLDGMNLANGWDRWVEDNRLFHNTFYSAAPSKRLITMIKSLQDPTLMFVSNALESHPRLLDRADHQHRELLEAFRAGDAELAIEINLAHLEIFLAE